jgi:hypothetical protein
MARRIVEAGGRTYAFSPDDEVVLSRRVWALVSGRVIDEVTGERPRRTITVLTEKLGLSPRVTSDGMMGVVGIPERLFPSLATQDYQIHLTVKAEGYLSRREEITIKSIIDFPNAFAPTDIGDLFLHREPIVIRGRTVLIDGSTTMPMGGVGVRITGVWWRLPPANQVVTAGPPNMISLRPPLYFGRAPVTGRLRCLEMTQIRGEDKQLLEDSSRDSTVLTLSNRVNLCSGDIILIDEIDPDRTEYLTIDTVLGASSADQPARVTLTHPLANPHRSHAVVRRVTPQEKGPDNPFDRDAIAGDVCVFSTSMSGLDVATTVEISGGASLPEYHSASRFFVTSDTDGYYRLPPLNRAAQVEIQADDGGAHSTITQIFAPDYTHRENHIDFAFR